MVFDQSPSVKNVMRGAPTSSQWQRSCRLKSKTDSFPFAGQGPVRAALAEIKGTFTWRVADATVSSSLDLGYTYGTAEFRAADGAKPFEQANYLRIWKREAGSPWKVVVDLVD